jgi:enterochelin esterase-like enzyme
MGWPLMATAITLLVVAPLATVLLWSRIRGPRLTRAVAKIGMILTCQLAAVLVAGLVVNDKFQLYSSWDDLLGRTGGDTFVQGDAFGGHGNSAGGGVNEQRFTRVGDLLKTTLYGPRSQAAGKVYVWLPPQYNEPRYAHQAFPVVELLQGYPSLVTNWFYVLHLDTTARKLMEEGKSTPFILVAPDINLYGGRNADCSNLPNGPQVATFLTADVRQMIEANFRTSTVKSGWGMLGYSEGAYCATKLALQYPQYFAAGVSLSGDTAPSGAMMGGDRNLINENSADWIIQHEAPPKVALLLAVSRQDGDTAQQAQRLASLAQLPTVIDLLIKAKGGHNDSVWESWLPPALHFLSVYEDGVTPVRVPRPLPSPTPSVGYGKPTTSPTHRKGGKATPTHVPTAPPPPGGVSSNVYTNAYQGNGH